MGLLDSFLALIGLIFFGMNFKGKVLAKKLACGSFSAGFLRDPFIGVTDKRLFLGFGAGAKLKPESGAHVDAGDVKSACSKTSCPGTSSR